MERKSALKSQWRGVSASLGDCEKNSCGEFVPVEGSHRRRLVFLVSDTVPVPPSSLFSLSSFTTESNSPDNNGDSFGRRRPRRNRRGTGGLG